MAIINRQDDKASSSKLRAEAEKKVAKSTGKAAALKKHDQDILVHELQVHQVELEMQNEELRRTEAELQASRERYFDLYNLAPVGYFSISEQGIILEANLTGANMLGVLPRDLRAQRFSSLIFKADQDIYYLHRQQLFKTRAPQLCEMRMVRRDGSLFWVRIEADLAQDGRSGKPVCRAAISDITAQKQAEAELKSSEDKYRILFMNAAEGIGVVQDGRFRLVNPKLVEMLGYNEQEALSIPVAQFIHPEDRESVMERHVRRLKGEIFKNLYEFRAVNKSGNTRFVEISTVLIDWEGRPATLDYYSDVTERKQAEEEVKDREAKYRLLSDNTVDGVWLLDMNLKLIYCSPSSAKQSGFTLQEIMEMPLDRYLSPESLQVVAEVFLREIPRAEADPDYREILTLELEFLKKDGTYFWAECKFSIIRDENGKPVSILGQGRDITERKLAEEKLQNSYASLKKTLNDAINTMVKIVEMRDPYTAGHQQRVADLATAIAGGMNLEDNLVEQIRTASIIHDIGKMNIPSDILSKPGRLSDVELKLIKTHARGGYDIVKDMDFPCHIAQAVLQHHERLDGSGYPDGLQGEDTLLEARILAVADVVEAMASHRPYRPALGIDKALEELAKNRGTLYDPAVVDACLGLFSSGKFEFKPI